ncbi:MAG: hypothetical protein BME93_02390 [Methanosarcinales archaeon Met12]|nr:MAG: hypothetical protein BME93_02390 [Methanosarcinales archaeon Met12]
MKFTIEESVDQIFTLETDKAILKFGANDLGVWLIELKKKRER